MGRTGGAQPFGGFVRTFSGCRECVSVGVSRQDAESFWNVVRMQVGRLQQRGFKIFGSRSGFTVPLRRPYFAPVGEHEYLT